MRALVRFEKTGPARHISHLDLQRLMQRAIRRAGIPAAYSQGFNPHMQLSFATALGLGLESVCEAMEIVLAGEISPEALLEALGRVLPEGIHVTRCTLLEGKSHLTASISAAAYVVSSAGDHSGAVLQFMQKESHFCKKRSKKGDVMTDIRPLVLAASAEEGKLKLLLTHSPSASLSPELLLGELGIQRPWRIMRTGLFETGEGGLKNIWGGDDTYEARNYN